MELLQVSFKLVIGFLLLFLLIRIIGKKLIDQLTPFHFIAAIVLGELLGNAVYNHNVPIFHVVVSVSVWGILLFLVDFLAQKSMFLREKFEGKPSMVIRNGQIDFDQLKSCRMNLNQLQSLLRQSETFSIREVAFAFIEANGSISILKKAQYQKTTLEDLNIPPEPVYLPMTLIKDRKLDKENLAELKKDVHWLTKELKAKGIFSIEEVLLAEWLEGDGLLVIPHSPSNKNR
ncbi:DUF421 domain-containing protein [Jeotgalibacillus proteolyticus]|uniref:DUF421 domain-containing protein n=1 Tax=Jeotgalibacillus proteolyticus TaxID=2082395 RepID=A0A2S5G8M8_9BACL|nr:DUF421 domain-containing protein [Jeotgalibacillus proteolyticus]PPA69329.1 DUF421 domain-containing protein [Jeotgalibacillus proteolyticus]